MHKKFKILGILWLVLITVACLIELEINNVSTPSFTDKIVHFSFYFIANYLFLKAKISKNYIISLFLIVYGIIIEVFQEKFTQSRHFDYFDIIANSTGVLVALMLNLYLHKRKSNV